MRRPTLAVVLVTILFVLTACGDDPGPTEPVDSGVGPSAPTLSVPGGDAASGGAVVPSSTSEPGSGIIGPTAATAGGAALQPGLIDVSAITTCAELAESIVPLFDEMGARSSSLADAGGNNELMAQLSATIGSIKAKQTALGCDVEAMSRATCAALATSDSPLAEEYVRGSC